MTSLDSKDFLPLLVNFRVRGGGGTNGPTVQSTCFDDILRISGDCWESWVVVPVKGGGGR